MWNSRRAEQFQRIAAAEEAQKAEEVRREKSMAERDKKFTQHREKLQGELKCGGSPAICVIYTKSLTRRLLFYPVIRCLAHLQYNAIIVMCECWGEGGGVSELINLLNL